MGTIKREAYIKPVNTHNKKKNSIWLYLLFNSLVVDSLSLLLCPWFFFVLSVVVGIPIACLPVCLFVYSLIFFSCFSLDLYILYLIIRVSLTHCLSSKHIEIASSIKTHMNVLYYLFWCRYCCYPWKNVCPPNEWGHYEWPSLWFFVILFRSFSTKKTKTEFNRTMIAGVIPNWCPISKNT